MLGYSEGFAHRIMLILEQELIYIHRNAVWKFRICDTPSDAEILNLL